MKFSYSAVWDDTLRLIRAHGPLLAAVAGVFIFFPSLLLGYLMPPPDGRSPDPAESMRMAMDYYTHAWPWFLLVGLLAMWGALAVLRLVFVRQITVASAIAGGVVLLPFYFLASMIAGFVIGLGLILLVVPGLYLTARLIIVGPVMVAENRLNPLDAISRAFALTKGNGWAILGLFVLILIAGLVVITVINALLGIVFTLVAGRDLGRLLALIVSSATSAGFTVMLTIVYASIYRSLAGEVASTAEIFE
jgi:hypothetical protein